jgi:hypothetical protein
MRTLLAALVAALFVLLVPTASAKDFRPGDLRVCGPSHCVAIVDRNVLPMLGSFYYGNRPLVRAHRPALGVRYYQLRFDNGYVTGIVATRRLDRFLSYGVNLGRFKRDGWYSIPSGFSVELGRLTAELRPFRLSRAALARSR